MHGTSHGLDCSNIRGVYRERRGLRRDGRLGSPGKSNLVCMLDVNLADAVGDNRRSGRLFVRKPVK